VVGVVRLEGSLLVEGCPADRGQVVFHQEPCLGGLRHKGYGV
jgi:hypothetical protein